MDGVNVLAYDKVIGRFRCLGFVDSEKGERTMAVIGSSSSDSVGSARQGMEFIQSGRGDVV
jgi:hypothetical protein